jgi:hypothetical protein
MHSRFVVAAFAVLAFLPRSIYAEQAPTEPRPISNSPPADGKKATAAPEAPPETPSGPLQLRLVAKKDKYAIDLGGLTPAEYSKQIQLETKTVPPPEVDFILELKNTGTEPLTIARSDLKGFELELKGEGALTVSRRWAGAINPSTKLTLEAGKTHTWPIKQLSSLFNGGKAAGGEGSQIKYYWTQPGEYTLTAKYHYQLPMGNAYSIPAILTSASIKIKVVNVKK